MKFLLPLIVLFQVQTNAAEIGSFTECSDPAANVVYLQLEGDRFLEVTAMNEFTGQLEKIQLNDFSITQRSATFLEKRTLFSCAESPSKIEEELTFRKVAIKNNDGTTFPAKIIGVSADKTFIPVDYLCKKTIVSECL